jgi:hypothetical protein
MCSAVVLMAVFLPLAASAASPATERLTIRGKEQELNQKLLDAVAWIRSQRR